MFKQIGEFDPGSGRTLAACLTHASRAISEYGGELPCLVRDASPSNGRAYLEDDDRETRTAMGELDDLSTTATSPRTR